MKGDFTRVALNIFKIPFTKELMAEKTAENMRKRGMEVSEPVEKDGFSVGGYFQKRCKRERLVWEKRRNGSFNRYFCS